MKVIRSLMLVFLMLALSHVSNARTPPITEITVECNSSWSGFTYKYTFRKDGTIAFIAPNFRSESPTTNTYYGKFDDFVRLARLIEQTKFFSLKSEYVANEIMPARLLLVRCGRAKGIKSASTDAPVHQFFMLYKSYS